MHDWAAVAEPANLALESGTGIENGGGGGVIVSFLESREALAPQGIGKSVPRREDARLLSGQGRTPPISACPAKPTLRAPFAACARQDRRIEAAAAFAAPGVLAVLTGSDAAADGIAPDPAQPGSGQPA